MGVNYINVISVGTAQYSGCRIHDSSVFKYTLCCSIRGVFQRKFRNLVLCVNKLEFFTYCMW